VGAATFGKSVEALRDGGDLVHFGNASGSPAVDQTGLATRPIRYFQPSTGQFVKDRKGLDEASFDLLAAFRAGSFGNIHITRYPLSEAIQAHKDIAARRIVGLVILVP
jgi:NADPH2:quinone reductase